MYTEHTVYIAVQEIVAEKSQRKHRILCQRTNTTFVGNSIRSGNLEMVEALIKAGADVHAKDSLGMTASLWASLRLRTGTEDLLRLSGCTEAISSIVIYFFTVLLALLIYFTIMWVSFKG